MSAMNGDDARRPVDDEALHAFVDGQLDAERAAEVIDALARDPHTAARVAAWQAQRLAMRRLAREMPLDETPPALSDVVRRAAAGARGAPRAWTSVAAVAAALAVGGASGWWAQQALRGPERSLARVEPAASQPVPGFVRDAAIAHAVFVPEQRHPVEVGADDEAHLVQWLSRRLGAPLRVPSLAQQGFHLLGGRLLPGEGAPRAQFMFEDGEGRRVTLFVAVFEPGSAPQPTAAFGLAQDGASSSFYWVEDRFGYALSAALPPSQLQALARSVHGQLQR